MGRREANLLVQIEKDALDESVPLATALRKCVVLGGKSGSEQLRDWATRELQGYEQKEVPDYRVVGAPLQIDGFSGNFQFSRKQFPPSELPDFVQEHITEEVELREGVGGLEALANRSEIKLMPMMGGDLVRVLNSEIEDPSQHIDRIYWNVSPSALHGVLDRIRTGLAQLVAELQAGMTDNEDVPSPEAANQAVRVVVTGKRSQVNVTTAQTSGASGTAVARSDEDSPLLIDSPFWTNSRRIGAFVVGGATVAGAIIAAIQL